MRGRFAVFALFLAGACSLSASAVELGARTFYVGSIGRVHDASASDPRVWLEYELEDWKDPATGTTEVLGQGCGLNAKFRLLGTHRRNYLEIEARADAGENAIPFDPAKVELSVGAGPSRPSGYNRAAAAVELGAGDILFAAIPFADKNEFAGQNEIRARVPFGGCVVEAVFKRPAGQTELEASSRIWSRMQVSLELGSGVGKTGNLKNVASNGLQGGMTVTRYPWIHHGVWLGLEFQSLGGPSGFGAALGYSYRRFISARWSVHYDIGLGVYELSDASNNLQPQALNNAILIAQKIGVDWVFGRLGEPVFLESDHAIGILFSDDWLPGASLAGNPASGQNFSLQFRYLFGI